MPFLQERDLEQLAHSVCDAKTPLGAFAPSAVAGRRLRVGRQAEIDDSGRRRLLDLLRELHVAGGDGERGSPQLVVVRKLVSLPRERRLSVRRESIALRNSWRGPSSSNSFSSFVELTLSQRWTARHLEPFNVMLGTGNLCTRCLAGVHVQSDTCSAA